jgi:hypothetical protein
MGKRMRRMREYKKRMPKMSDYKKELGLDPTLLKNEPPFNSYKYFSMDDLDTLAQVERDAFLILSSGRNIIIDEAQ